MSNDFLQLILNTSGAALVTGLFIYYLIKKDKRDEEKDLRVNNVINSYLKESIKVKKDLAMQLQRNADTLIQLESIVDKIASMQSK